MDKDITPKITITKDGPYRVTAGIPLNQAGIECDERGVSESWGKGKTYDTANKDYLLCRCGMSDKKPFCDATHSRTNFRGRESADRPPYLENAKFLRGPGMDLLDDDSLCVGARFCDKEGTIWRNLRQTNLPEAQELVLDEACKCPGGRLTAVSKDGRIFEPKLPQEISLIEDVINNARGPIWVKGGIPVEGPGGEKYETRNRVTLCRCGLSHNSPYCDASHYRHPKMTGLDE